MAIIPVNINITDDSICNDILAGTLELYGLVKDNNHKIVKHLPIVNNELKTGTNKFLSVVKQHKGATVAVSSVVALAAGTATTLAYISNKNKKKYIMFFNECLECYFSSIKNGSLSIDTIDNLMSCLDILQKKKIKLKIQPDNLTSIIFCIINYTTDLAKANNRPISFENFNGKHNNIIDIKEYLEIQKDIISKVS